MGGVKSKFIKCCACCGHKKEKDTYNIPTPDINDTNTTQKLLVKGVDFCSEINGEDHHTERFNLMKRKVDQCLVVRRGQAFNLKIILSRPFLIKTDDLTFILQVADEDIRSDDTTAKILLSKDKAEAKEGWSAVYRGQSDSSVTVTVTSPSNCVVSKWTVEIKATMRTEAGAASSVYIHPLPIYILFNPWCKSDGVYMPDAIHREECVENDEGMMFAGNSNDIRWNQWSYAQYDKDILECAVHLVKNIGMIKGRARGDPIATVRALSAAVNANDDFGVLAGKWGTKPEDYADGTSPMLWMSSSKILQQYYETKTYVKYAQCWVFAGVLTTVCRALGIPCRPVTCFASAHDTNGNLTVEYIIDENGKEKKLDSIWNFHVWNEAWMSRPDVGAEYGGWQIVDATPQERSDRLFKCGPAPLAAVYNGETKLPYDVPFVFAEVNADWVTWKSTGSGADKKLISVDTRTIGQYISTKAVGKWDREDLTDRYKPPEGTTCERETLIKALVNSESDYARYYRNQAFEDVKFEIKWSEDVMIGQDFEVVLHMRNGSTTSSHHVTGHVYVRTETYRGRDGNSVKRQAFDVQLKPEGKTQVTLLVTFDDYYKKLVDQASFNVLGVANIADIDYDYVSPPVKFSLRDPELKIEFDGMKTLLMKLINPLPIALTNGTFHVEASELNARGEKKISQDIPPGCAARAFVGFTPPQHGVYRIAAKFSSDELHCIDGHYTLTI